MTDRELQTLLAQPPDHPLDALAADIWVRVGQHERCARQSRGLLLLQAAVLVGALAGSVFAGVHWSQSNTPALLDVFSPDVALNRLVSPAP